MALAFDQRDFLVQPQGIVIEGGPTGAVWSEELLGNPEGIRVLSSIIMKAVSDEAKVSPSNRRVWDEINTRSQLLACTDDEWALIRNGMRRNSK